jgi:hypothetical protein
VVDEELFEQVTVVLLLASGIVPIIAVIGAVVFRFAGHRPGRRWGTLVVLAFGVQVGTIVVFTEDVPLERALVLGAAGLVTIGLLWRERRLQAGAFLIGSALPWTLLWGYYVALLVGSDTDIEPILTWTLFAAGFVPLVIGGGLVVAGDPLPPEPDPAAPSGKPGSRRVGVVARAIVAPEALGPIPISELAAFATAVVAVLGIGALGLPDPLEDVLQIVVATLASLEARLIARPPAARRALEAFSWLGEWEFQRVRALAANHVPTTPSAAEKWLETVPDRPDSRWMRVEVLAWLNRLDEARRVAETMPEETAYDRFERVYALDLVDWMGGAPGDPAAVRAAAAGIDPIDVDTVLRAEVALAVRETARRAAANGPEGAAEPLITIRSRLGSRADGQLRRALWRRTLPVSAVTAVVVWLFMGSFG